MNHEIPGVAIVPRAAGDCFGAVEDRAASDRDDKVDPVFLYDPDTLAHRLNLRVWGDPGEFKDSVAFLMQDLPHGVIEPDPFHGAAAVGEQYLAPVPLDETREFRHTALPENKMRGKIKIIRLNHFSFPLKEESEAG